MTGPWHAVDGEGRDLASGRPPRPPGWPSPAAAVAAAPVVSWPLRLVDGVGSVDLAGALGPGGDRVVQLLEALAGPGEERDVEALARATPGGWVDLPLATVTLGDGVAAAAKVDRGWLASVEQGRDTLRSTLLAAGRDVEVEGAVHVAMLLGTERLDPVDDADVDAHVASGARLWLLTGAVVSALAGAEPDRFAAWGRLVAAGWWPIGPSGGRLVLSGPG